MQQCVPTKKVARNERHLGYGNEAKTCLEAETPLACAAGIEKSTTKREKGYIVDRRERRLCVCPHFVVWARRVCEKQKATSFIERIHRTSWGVRARKPFARIFGQRKTKEPPCCPIQVPFAHLSRVRPRWERNIHGQTRTFFLMPNRKRKAPVWCANKTPASTSSRKGSLVNSL